MDNNFEKEYRSEQEAQKDYESMSCFMAERLGMSNEPPFKDSCKNCPLVDWRGQFAILRRPHNEVLKIKARFDIQVKRKDPDLSF